MWYARRKRSERSTSPWYAQPSYGQQQGGYGQPEPTPTGAADLPPGWQELSANGQVYYWNTQTNQTQYERPY